MIEVYIFAPFCVPLCGVTDKHPTPAQIREDEEREQAFRDDADWHRRLVDASNRRLIASRQI